MSNLFEFNLFRDEKIHEFKIFQNNYWKKKLNYRIYQGAFVGAGHQGTAQQHRRYESP